MKALPLALLAALAVPATAQAATMQPLADCYVSASPEDAQREQVEVLATGFAPGATVDVAVDGQLQTVTAAADGSVRTGAPAPYHPTGYRKFNVTVTERANPSNYVYAETLVTALELVVEPRQARPRRKVVFRVRGFTSGQPVYAHYLFKEKSRRTVRLGTPEGPCGSLKVRRRQFPMKRPRIGEWTLQADHDAAYDALSTSPRAWLEIDVQRVFRRP
jgi:hypothetical protein